MQVDTFKHVRVAVGVMHLANADMLWISKPRTFVHITECCANTTAQKA